MLTFYQVAFFILGVILVAQQIYIARIHLKKKRKKSKAKQSAKAGRDIGTQAGRDVIHHHGTNNQELHYFAQCKDLQKTVEELFKQLRAKDEQLQANGNMKNRLMTKIERLDEIQAGLLNEITRLSYERKVHGFPMLDFNKEGNKKDSNNYQNDV